MLATFIESLKQLDDNQFKIALGLTKPQFEELSAEFKTLKDSTRKLNDTQKIYAILVIVNWSLDHSFVGSLILHSKISNAKRDGETFVERVMPRLQESLKATNIALAIIPENRKKEIFSLDEILQCVEQENKKNTESKKDDFFILRKAAVPAKTQKTVKIAENEHAETIEPLKRTTGYSIKKEVEKKPVKEEGKKIQATVSEPGFLVNITAYVPSDTETSSSDYSDVEEEFEFADEDFDNPPFEIRRDQRGALELELVATPAKTLKKYESKVVKPLLAKLEEEGFADEEDNGKEKAKKHLAVSFGLNRPKSLSTGKNKVLIRELGAEIETELPNSRFGLFWKFDWKRKKNVSSEVRRKNPLTHEEISSFYRQLKKRSPEKARDFRRSEENQGRNSMVPYRELREKTKNHQKTRALVVDLRKRNPGADVYMSFVDSDTLQFQTDKKGVFQAYTDLYRDHNTVEVMSTGYEYISEKTPILQLACLLDRRVREATALYIPFGVYYPEPNFIVKIIEGADTVEESFFELTPTGKISSKNYTSPQESPTLLEKVAKRTNANLPHFSLFCSQNPVQIIAPKRAEHNKAKGALSFDAQIEKNGKYIRWSEQDITSITRSIAQSHVSGRDWAINLLNAFECAEEVTIGNIVITDGGEIRRMAISLLSRLYNKYDPITLNGVQPYLKNESYQQHFQRVLQNYDAYSMGNSIEKTSHNTYGNKTKKGIAWATIDNLSHTAELKEMLGHLLVGADIGNIEKAAIGAGLAIRNTFLEFLEFSPLQTHQKVTIHV